MNALSNEFDLAEATMLSPDTGTAGEPAQLGRETIAPEVADLPQRAARKGGWHYAMAARGIDDIAAFMQPGLRALLALTAKGQDTTAAALTLWREFHAARCAIGELVETA